MKHLKSYKVFESISGANLELDVRDMFLELEEDYGYQVDISMHKYKKLVSGLGAGVNKFCIEASNDDLFQWSDVKDYFERAKEYIEDNNWSLTKSVLCYYPQGDYSGSYRIKTKEFSGHNWNGFIEFITDPSFIENNMINEIALIFDPKK
jgi:hypothetical protein